MTSLIPQTPTPAIQDGDSLVDVLTRVAAKKPVAEAERPAKTPKLIPVSPEQQKALQALTDDLRATDLPSERRALTDTEASRLIRLTTAVKVAKKTLDVAEAAVKEAVFSHFDVRLEEDEDPATLPVDPKTGHYLVGGELIIEDAAKRFTRELRQPSPDLTVDHLRTLEADGKIDHDEFLAATQITREIDEGGVMKLIQARPDILEALAEVIEPGQVSAAFYVRDVKKD